MAKLSQKNNNVDVLVALLRVLVMYKKNFFKIRFIFFLFVQIISVIYILFRQS